MSSPVRLRGEGGALPLEGPGRRSNVAIAARLDECIAAVRAAERASAAREIDRLTLLLNQHMDEVVHLTGTVEHLQRENDRLRAENQRLLESAASWMKKACEMNSRYVDALAAGAGAGEVAHD